jgi:hypothetical protein
MWKVGAHVASAKAIVAQQSNLEDPRNIESEPFDGTATIVWVNVHYAVRGEELLEHRPHDMIETIVEKLLQVVELNHENSESSQ